MQAPDRKPPVGIVFDSSLWEGPDRVFGLAMVLALSAKGEGRLGSLSISRNNLKIAGFADMLARFFGASPTIGMYEKGRTETGLPAQIAGPFERNTPEGKPLYNRVVQNMNDTADPVALIRNALTAQVDQNAVVILAGDPVNLLGLLALPSSKALIQKKVRTLVIAAPFEEGPAFPKLLAEWPGPIVVADGNVGQALPFPDGSIVKDLEWSPNHPLVDAYNMFEAAMLKPVEPRSSTMAAVLYAVQPQANHFKLSEPGKITLLSAGRIEFTANPQGRHRYLIADETKKESVIQMYRQLVSAKPPERRGRGGQQQP